MPELTTWADLPVEIVEQIIAICDTPTLLTLSYLNTQLNLLALETLFKREKVMNPKQGYLVSRLAKREIIPALNAALWLSHLPHVTYYLNPDVKRFFSEVRGLERLIDRVQANDRLDLYFSSVDRWFADTGPRRRSGERIWIEPELWKGIFLRLLETALNKGCKSMGVEGGHRMGIYYMDDVLDKGAWRNLGACQLNALQSPSTTIPLPPVTSTPHGVLPEEGSAVPKRPSVKKRFIRWVKKRLGLQASISEPLRLVALASSTAIAQATPPKVSTATLYKAESEPLSTCHSAVKSFETSNPCLKSLNLRSSMMFQPLFFLHTLNLIRAHSSTLATLELVSIRASQKVWVTFFQSISLPLLEQLIYLYDTLIVEEPIVTPTLLLEFFRRHPSLQRVELYGVNVGDQDQSAEIEFPGVTEGVLPNLVQLDAHPKIVSWLLQKPKACPNLNHICFTSEYWASRLTATLPHLNPYKTFDTGLLTLSSLLAPRPLFPPNPGHKITTADLRPIHLKLKLSTEFMLLEWFLSHTSTNNSSQQPKVLTSLTNVQKLTISTHFHTRLEFEHKQVIPRFLGLLPGLKNLELIDLPYPEEVKDSAFIEDVKTRVKTLERFVIGRSVVWDLDGCEGSIVDESW